MKSYGTVTYQSSPGARLGYFHINCDPHVAMVLRRLFDGAKRGRNNAVVVSGTDSNCHTLEWVLIKYPMVVDTPVLKRGADRQRQRMEMVDEARSPDYTPPTFDLAVPLRDYQRVAADLAIRSKGLLLGDDVGLGKAQPLDAKVLTPTGWRAIGDLVVGDLVVDPDGGTAPVTGVFPQGERSVYSVTTESGRSAESCEEHLWPVIFDDPTRIHVVQLDDLLRSNDRPRLFVGASSGELRTTEAIIEISWSRVAETRCIRVATKRHLYITNDSLVTHNTASAIATFVAPDTLPAVVVTLTHLTSQWDNEIRRFAPALRTHVIQRAQAYPLVDGYGWEVHKGKRRYVKSGIKKLPDVIILSYSKLVGWADMLISINPGMIVFDECQELRTGASEGVGAQGSKKNDAAKAIAFRSRFRAGLSVGPDSIVELRGSLFGAGWVGPIEDAAMMVAKIIGPSQVIDGSHVRDVESWGVESRGWTGSGFRWKRVRKFIVHECHEPVRALRVAGDALVLTDHHDVFVARRPDVLDQVPARKVIKGDIIPIDDGAGWGGAERIIDTASVLTHLGWAHVPVDLSGVDRHVLGVKQYEWKNYRKQGTFGSYLPVKLYLQHRHRLPPAQFIYLSKCKRITKVDLSIRLSDWAYVLGFFLGDGWLDRDNTRVSFAVELARKDDFLARLRTLPGITLDPKVRAMPGKSVEIRVSNVFFASVLFSSMGKRLCHEKTIPGEWIVSWPEAARRELLRGMLDSDGHVAARAGRRYYATSSHAMAKALLSLLRSLSIVGGIGTRKPSGGGVIGGRQIIGKRIGYMVHWSAFAESGDNTGNRGLRRALPGSAGRFHEGVVRRIEPAKVPALVYDLEMNGHPSFVANGALVHNSATPIFNLGGEVWNVMDVLSPGLLGDKSEFYSEWCSPQGNGKYLVTDINALRVYLTEEGAMLRRRRKDVGRELPPMMRNWQTVELNRKGLDSISSAVAELARAVLRDDIAPFAKMQAAGELDRQLRQATGVAKIPSVLAFIQMLIFGSDEPKYESVVVFAHHHLVFDGLMEGLAKAGIKAVKFTGKQSQKEKAAALDSFINGDAQVFLLSNRAGVGIDGLQDVCSTGVVAELDWSPGVHLQNEGRLNRDGQEDNVAFYYCVSDEGSDPVVRDVLGIKDQQRHGLVDGDLGDTSDEPPVDLNRMRKMAQAYLDKYKAP